MNFDILTNTPQPLQLQLPRFDSVVVQLVGCGGTGSHLLTGLASVSLELARAGTPFTLYLCDPDRVERKNVGRQLFSNADVGRFKAQVLADRLIASFGIFPVAVTRAVTQSAIPFGDKRTLSVVIGAVDNPAARAVIADAVAAAKGKLWWLDCGNENHSGQVALGNTCDPLRIRPALGMVDRLPAPHIVYPDLVATPPAPKRKAASCAELTASGEQGLMVNRMVAAHALAMLDAFLLRRDLRYFALSFDLQWGGAKSMAIDEPTLKSVAGKR